MPRSYRLGARAEQKAATRKRIVDAAAALYLDRGVSKTTMTDVARHADVAPGTVLNHFATSDVLAQAVVDGLVGSLALPTAAMLSGKTATERVTHLTRLLFAFYERGDPWYQVYAREPGVTAWANAEAAFYRDFDRLVRAALGDDAIEESVATLSAILGGGVYSTLRAQGRSSEASADLVIDLLTPWLERPRL